MAQFWLSINTQSVRFITGHTKDDALSLDWSNLTQVGQTLVFYMGLSNAPEIARQLQFHGMCGDMPAAIIERGTQSDQRVWTCALHQLPRVIQRHQPQSPSLIVVGEVVALRQPVDAVRQLDFLRADAAAS